MQRRGEAVLKLANRFGKTQIGDEITVTTFRNLGVLKVKHETHAARDVAKKGMLRDLFGLHKMRPKRNR